MDGILGRIDVVINGPTPDLSSHLINYDGRSLSRLSGGEGERETDVWPFALLISRHSLERGVEGYLIQQVLCSPVKICIRFQTVKISATTPELRVNTVNGQLQSIDRQ